MTTPGQTVLQQPKRCHWVDKCNLEHFKGSLMLSSQFDSWLIGPEGPKRLVDAGGGPRQNFSNAGVVVKVLQAVLNCPNVCGQFFNLKSL